MPHANECAVCVAQAPAVLLNSRQHPGSCVPSKLRSGATAKRGRMTHGAAPEGPSKAMGPRRLIGAADPRLENQHIYSRWRDQALAGTGETHTNGTREPSENFGPDTSDRTDKVRRGTPRSARSDHREINAAQESAACNGATSTLNIHSSASKGTWRTFTPAHGNLATGEHARCRRHEHGWHEASRFQWHATHES